MKYQLTCMLLVSLSTLQIISVDRKLYNLQQALLISLKDLTNYKKYIYTDALSKTIRINSERVNQLLNKRLQVGKKLVELANEISRANQLGSQSKKRTSTYNHHQELHDEFCKEIDRITLHEANVTVVYNLNERLCKAHGKRSIYHGAVCLKKVACYEELAKRARKEILKEHTKIRKILKQYLHRLKKAEPLKKAGLSKKTEPGYGKYKYQRLELR